MIPQSRVAQERFDRLLGGLAKLCRFELDSETVALYDMTLSALFPYEALCEAIQKIILERRTNDPFPAIRDIREILEPKSNPEAEAMIAANLVIERVAKDGHTNPDRARERMGELGWRVVQMCGGWNRICGEMREGGGTALRAQLRDTALAILKRGGAGLTEAPALPKPKDEPKQVGFKSFGEVMQLAHLKGKELRNENK